jgi:hypothetical protein
MNDIDKARPFTINQLRAYLVEVFPEFWESGDLRLEGIALIKLGKRLAVGEVAIYSDGESEMVAHATGTYSVPKRGQAVPL